MKLVNVEDLKVLVAVESKGEIRYGKLVTDLFDDISTVEAIPKEWIKNYARHKASKGFTEIDCYWQSWEDDVLKMVAAWEKENENRVE